VHDQGYPTEAEGIILDAEKVIGIFKLNSFLQAMKNILNPFRSSVPGRGLMNSAAHELRMAFLETFPADLQQVTASSLKPEQVKNNIESFIGSVEVPVGLVGPLLMRTGEEGTEETFGVVGTTEGALVASMNRGARAISESGGFFSKVLHQKMVRAPMFLFENMMQAAEFSDWISANFQKIKKIAEAYSNHAELTGISPVLIGKAAHLKFIYTTGDASGQNMTTTCTWHACLWIENSFNADHSFPVLHFVIDGNGSSDKKISSYAMQSGRGIHVISECFLSNETIVKVLRTTADDMFTSYIHSMAISRMDGMIGYNINVANAIAGFFVSTAQDLASIHESSTGILQLDKTAEGLYASLSLPNLVIGTVGGGTHLPAQNSILKFMRCEGKNGTKRLATLIAGFALSLELSTLAAIVSGQFARAHQKLGRNKPMNWLLRSEVDERFIRDHISGTDKENIRQIIFDPALNIDNGLLTQLTSRISKKLIGFIPFRIDYKDGSTQRVILKSKPTGEEVIKGLHFMAAALSTELSDKLLEYKTWLEYTDCDHKETEAVDLLWKDGFRNIPRSFGTYTDPAREISMLMMDYLDARDHRIMNSESSPELWTREIIRDTIKSICSVHAFYSDTGKCTAATHIKLFRPAALMPFYLLMNRINENEYADWNTAELFEELNAEIVQHMLEPPVKKSPLTFVHNDFNPRNIAVTHSNDPLIYDWELAVLNIPQRDSIELLSFVLPENFSREELLDYLTYHHQLFTKATGTPISIADWLSDCRIIVHEYLCSRVSFYLAGGTLMDYSFSKRIFLNAFRMKRFLDVRA
jgi:hydroxymethylglutaryl-CoA reductase (NADPH)